jgi:diguanylate cyclase (GGDEF)-like protein/PAS domain S-box-containing protein
MREGERRSFTGLVRDITERRFAEEQLFQEKELALVTLHSIGDGVIRTDETGAITYMNPVAERLTGCTTDTVRGHPLARVLRLSENRNGELTTAPVDAVMSKGETIHSLDGITLHGRHGGQYAIEYSASPVRNRAREVIGAVFVFRDVSAKHDLLHKLAWQARHDPLTGLVNRQELERRVEHALTSAKTFRREHALLFIDLDQFKVVNDTSGHRAGDELLRQITGQLMLGLRHRDTLARMGGDEFAVLLENCSVAQAQLVAEKMRDLVQGFRFVWEGKVFKLGLSIGVVAIDEHSLGLADVLSAADAACYAAKDAGRNRVQMHSPNNAELTARRTEMEWVFNIHQVLDENRFCLYFQPIQPLDDGGTTRWEVLLRMVGTDGQLILPGVFLPAAERYGLMANVDRWVVRSTLAALTEQNQNGHGFPAVSINMSPTSLADEKFLGFVKEQFKAFPVPPERVCFEITETAAIANFAKAKHFMGEMKKLGSNFALDDFGSGMSSFGYLRSLPVDYLKIDGAFVRNLARDAVDLATVECINRIGHLMGMRTVAEYAEDVAVIDQLRQIGIDYAQGYGVRAPVNQAEFSRLISG